MLTHDFTRYIASIIYKEKPVAMIKRVLPQLLLVGIVCSAMVAVVQIPAFSKAASELWTALSGQTDSYGTGHAVGSFVRAASRFCVPYVLWIYRQRLLVKQLA